MATIRIAHLSDLHFGALGQIETWGILKRHVIEQVKKNLIHLAIVTGDIADTPNDNLLRVAHDELESLGVAYYVCAGNHDRHKKGNTARVIKPVNSLINWWNGDGMAKFSRWFEGRIPTLRNVANEKLTDGQDEWQIRIAGADSSINADISARGFLPPEDQDLLRQSMGGPDSFDLGILLFHHHLLPVRVLERNIEPKKLSWSDITRFTALINAGTAMEVLASAHIDIVLHGHEHAANWGRYGTLEASGGETSIIGAGSATGTVTLSECSPEKMSYNLVNLYPDRSADLFVMAYSGGSFRTREQFPLMNAETMRRHRFLRQLKSEDAPVAAAESVKVIEFTVEGDGNIYQYQTEWTPNASEEWNVRARNVTGTPEKLRVRFIAPDDDSYDLKPTFVRLGIDGAWEAKQKLTDSFFDRHADTSFRVEESYRWRGGAILTAKQMAQIRSGSDAGIFRSDGKEFGAISIRRWFASAMLVVKVPPDLAPNPKSLEVWAIDDAQPTVIHSARRDISGGLRLLGQGLYSLSIPYPRKGWRYCLSWLPSEADQ
jgi:predicted MPP superfamily phosphohydrolase